MSILVLQDRATPILDTLTHHSSQPALNDRWSSYTADDRSSPSTEAVLKQSNVKVLGVDEEVRTMCRELRDGVQVKGNLIMKRARTRAASDQHSISTARIFADCTSRERARLDQLATAIRVSAGTLLTKEGSNRRELGVLLDGTATVQIGGRTVATLQPGDHYGELSFLASLKDPAAAQTATVVADDDQWIAVLAKAEARTLLDEFPNPSAALRSLADERQAENERRA